VGEDLKHVISMQKSVNIVKNQIGEKRERFK